MSKGPVAGSRAALVIPGDANDLSPNKRLCWQAKRAMVGRWRLAAKAKALELGWPETPRRVRLDWIVRRGRSLDAANCHGSGSLKGCEDGLVDAGIVPDDTPKYVQWGTVEQEIGAQWKLNPELQVTITVMEDLQ